MISTIYKLWYAWHREGVQVSSGSVMFSCLENESLINAIAQALEGTKEKGDTGLTLMTSLDIVECHLVLVS